MRFDWPDQNQRLFDLVRWRRLWLGLFACVCSSVLLAEEFGRTHIDYFSWSQLGTTDYNYGIAQDDKGRMWIANEGPLLMFDGARWRAVQAGVGRTGSDSPLPRHGRIYASDGGDLGYFEESPGSIFQWHSLNSLLPDSARHFDRVTGPVMSGDAVWYLTSTHLVRIADDGNVRLLPAEELEPSLSVVGQRILVELSAGGLRHVVLRGETLHLEKLPQLETAAASEAIDLVALIHGEEIVMNAQRELFRVTANGWKPWAEECWPDFASGRLQSLLPLKDGGLALGFLRGGVWVLNPDGLLKKRFDEGSGAQIGSVSSLFEDREQGIWVAQIGGVARIDRSSGVTRFGIESGIGQALSLVRHEGFLYAAGRTGIFQLRDQGAGASAQFARVTQTPPAAAHLLSRGNRLWLAGGTATRLQFDDHGELIATDAIAGITGARRFAVSKNHPRRVYVLSIDASIDVLDDADSEHPLRRRIEGVSGTSSRLVVTADESLWLSTADGAVWRVKPDSPESIPTRLNANDGLPASGVIDIDSANDTLVVKTEQGLMTWDEQHARFQSMSLDGPLAHAKVRTVVSNANGDWYASGPDAIGVWRHDDSGFHWDQQALDMLSPDRDAHDFLQENEVLWIARSDGVERVELGKLGDASNSAALLTDVEDSLLHRRVPIMQGPRFELPPETRDLRFEMALPVFSGATRTRYRSRLIGNDDDYSTWSEQAERAYTNLADGAFTFAAQAMSPRGEIAQATEIEFSISPPWWRTTIARIIYLLLAVAVVALTSIIATRRRTAQMQSRQTELEVAVADRTEELADQNVQLAQQALQLKETDRLKTRFFVNVGHEFRSPLTLILGPLQNVLGRGSAQLDDISRTELEMADRNARHVLDLIIELMDVNRLEHGRFSIQRKRLDFVAFVQRVVEQAIPLVHRYGQQLTLNHDCNSELLADLDPVQIERCLLNLISNAAKYMERGGTIDVQLSAGDDWLGISVRDQGRGISAGALPHVFDRFFQVEGSDSASGYGIGLALVRELVEGHDGSVRVESTPDIGSVFTIILPRFTGADDTASPIQQDQPGMPLLDEFEIVKSTQAPAQIQPDLPLALIVDDNADMRVHVRRVIESKFSVIEAVDGPSGFAAACDELPDVIICDVMMPGFDGVEFASRLRREPSTETIGLILLTAKVGSEHAVAGLRAGADDYLAKPFDSSELLARVEALLLAHQRLRRKLQSVTSEPVYAAPASTALASPSNDDERFLLRLQSMMEHELGNAEFGVDELANALHMDRSNLYRRVKDLCQVSPSDYFRERRLLRAQSLLLARAGNVSEVAYAVGFNSLSSFTRAFKARFGLPPSSVYENC